MSCYIPPDKRIVIGRTKKKAIVTICINCQSYWIPHFNYISKKYEVTFSLLSPKFVDTFENIELEDRTDVEEFLNKIVDKEEVNKNNKIIKKLNKDYLRNQKRSVRKYPDLFTKIDKETKYFNLDIKDIEEDMTYWELVVKLWNSNNEEQTSKNLLKPYYRNFIEYIDSATFGSNKILEGRKLYTKMDQERTPHFYYKLNTGEEFGILFEKAEYLQPISRTLTQKELDFLVKILNAKKGDSTIWERGAWLWNNQNYEGNEYNLNWFPKYKKIEDNIKIPDYTKLNENYKK